MFTFLHDIAQQNTSAACLTDWKIILYLPRQTSNLFLLIQQKQHGDFKQNDMANFAEALYKATK